MIDEELCRASAGCTSVFILFVFLPVLCYLSRVFSSHTNACWDRQSSCEPNQKDTYMDKHLKTYF